eukprot:1347146-Rhodomonas_salina.6
MFAVLVSRGTEWLSLLGVRLPQLSEGSPLRIMPVRKILNDPGDSAPCAYALAMRFPGLTPRVCSSLLWLLPALRLLSAGIPRIRRRDCDAIVGTDIVRNSIDLRGCYAMRDADLAHGFSRSRHARLRTR